MDSKSNSHPIHIFFLPFVGGGHQIPMIDIARVFAVHGVTSTIITTPKNSLSFQNSVHRSQIAGLPISIHALSLPENAEISDTDMSAKPFTDTSMLQQPLVDLLLQTRPDCIVHDIFHRWCAAAVDGIGIGVTRIAFSGSGCFSRCVQENLTRFKPHETVESDFDPFVVPDLPDKIELTRSQVPIFMRNQTNGSVGNMKNSEDSCFGTVINSFYELEPNYVEYLRTNLGKKAWLVGPVSLCNRNTQDKAERGKKGSIDEKTIVNFLNSKKPNSIVYISFGSLVNITQKQLLEIAHGVESSGHPFIWVVRNEGDDWIPNGFEERIKGKGLVIRGWAPQLLILEHEAVGAFVTHCGWNSTLEGICAGKAMVTWPVSAEQFSNEKLVVDVLRIGVKAGSLEWQSFNTVPTLTVGREKVDAVIKAVMESEEMRRRAKELAFKARKAVEDGGSSFMGVENLIQALKSLRKN